MIDERDLKEIDPGPPKHNASHQHVQAGSSIPKPARVRMFSSSEWEEFVEEWATSLQSTYRKVRRFAGPGDLGVDIAGFATDEGFSGLWDNYQCKHYGHPLQPNEVWVEIGKIIHHSHRGEYSAPRKHYFVGPQGVGTTLERLLNKPDELKRLAAENWDKHCREKIVSTETVSLTGALKTYFDEFDFTIFSSKSVVELIDGHSTTGHHAVRFGGGLPPRPHPPAPPAMPGLSESRYIRQLLDAYGDHLSADLADADALTPHAVLKRDFLRQRERFYHAEALRNFARDTVPEGTFDALQDEVFHGVIDISDDVHVDGFRRMKATVAQAAQVSLTANPLSSVTKTQDRQGICHQLANEDRLTWVPDNE